MPTVRVLTPPTPQAEPVSLALAVAALRLDLDAASADPAILAQLELLQVYVSAAREKVEAYTGRYYAAQTLSLTYELGEGYALPAGFAATAVTGFYADLDALEDAAAYLEEYRKGISINRELPWGVALTQTFTVTAELSAVSVSVPALVRSAILELAGEWYRNRETTAPGAAGLSELPVSWKVKLAPLRAAIYG